jgi:hypothetical protein
VVVAKVRELERKRDSGTVGDTSTPTVAWWLEHWLTTIAPRRLRQRTLESYESAVRKHLIPGIGRHRGDLVGHRWFIARFLTAAPVDRESEGRLQFSLPRETDIGRDRHRQDWTGAAQYPPGGGGLPGADGPPGTEGPGADGRPDEGSPPVGGVSETSMVPRIRGWRVHTNT